MSTLIPRTDVVAGKVDQAVNEAIGDIWPGAHVAVTWFDATEETWNFELVLPGVRVQAPPEITLEELIDRAEQAVQGAKAALLTAWGVSA